MVRQGGRKREVLDEFFRTWLRAEQRRRIEAACVDMWEPFTQSIQSWCPDCKIVYDKFHVPGHANGAVDEVRRAEFFRAEAEKRGVVRGKRWLLLSRRDKLEKKDGGKLEDLFRLNRPIMKAHLLKESLDRLRTYTCEGAAQRYLNQWIDGLRWQRLKPFQKLAKMLLSHQEGILNQCRVKVRFGVVEAINKNPHHPRGRHKARVFASIGIREGDAEELRTALLRAARDAEAQAGVLDAYGQRYVVDLDLVRLAEP